MTLQPSLRQLSHQKILKFLSVQPILDVNMIVLITKTRYRPMIIGSLMMARKHGAKFMLGPERSCSLLLVEIVLFLQNKSPTKD